MKKAWKIGISTIAGIVGACVLIRIHNAEVRKVYCERYGKGYDEGYALGLYQGKLMGANDLYMNAHNGSEYFNNYMIEARKEFVETNTKLNKKENWAVEKSAALYFYLDAKNTAAFMKGGMLICLT